MIGSRQPYAEYAAIQALNASALKRLDVSPLHYRHYMQHGGGDESDPLRVGTGLHTLLFEPDLFDEEIAVWEGDRRGNAWKEFAEANASRTILKTAQVDLVRGMADAILEHPAIAPYLEGVESERTITWTDPRSGFPCKARLDGWHPATRTLLDLKSAADANPRAFGNAAARLKYDLQLAHYKRGVEAVTGEALEKVAVIVVEKAAPYDCGLLTISDDFLYAAEERLDALFAKLRGCLDTGIWPGRYPEESPLEFPAYLLIDSEGEASFEVATGLENGVDECTPTP